MPADRDDPDATENLSRFGWDERWQDVWRDIVPAHGQLLPARVSAVHRGACDVETPIGPQRAESAAGVGPTAGDWVVLDLTPGAARVVDVLPRRTTLRRAAVSGASHEQVLAANVDVVLVAVAPDSRRTPARVERLLALAWDSGARPLIVLTKADLLDDAGREAELAELLVSAPGAEVLAASATTGAGVQALRRTLAGTVVVLGSSGAGKSSLVNALAGRDVMATSAVRDADGRGRHTTVHRQLLALPGGLVLVDTPGLRGVGVTDLDGVLAQAFSDIEDLAVDCRFADCAHAGEPGCAVLAAIGSGLLPGRRLESFRKLQREQAFFAARTDARLRAERKKHWKQVAVLQRSGRP